MKKIRKYFLCILIIIFVCNTGKAYAVQRVVTSHIISNVWYENIFLIADKADGMATKNFTVQIGGGVDSVGDELLYNFPNWYNVKFAPILFYEDINSDGLNDIIVALISGAGSGISTEEIHVLNQVHDPDRRYEEVPVESINDAVNQFVKMKRKGNAIVIQIGEKKYIVDYSKFGYYTPANSPGVGSIEDYKPENGVLYGYTTVFVSIPEASIGSLKVKYYWDGKMYKAESVTFNEAKPMS